MRTQVAGVFKDSYLLDFVDRSPALVTRYETQMIPKSVLQLELREWSQMLQADGVADEDEI